MGNCFLTNGKIFPSDHLFVIKGSKINTRTLFSLIKFNSNQIDSLSYGSTIKGISKNTLSKIKIRLPKNRKLIDTLNPLFDTIDNLNETIKDKEKLYKQYLNELKNESIIGDVNNNKIKIISKTKIKTKTKSKNLII